MERYICIAVILAPSLSSDFFCLKLNNARCELILRINSGDFHEFVHIVRFQQFYRSYMQALLRRRRLKSYMRG